MWIRYLVVSCLCVLFFATHAQAFQVNDRGQLVERDFGILARGFIIPNCISLKNSAVMGAKVSKYKLFIIDGLVLSRWIHLPPTSRAMPGF